MNCKTKQGSNTPLWSILLISGLYTISQTQGYVTETKRGLEERSVSQNALHYIEDERDRVMTAVSDNNLRVCL